MARAPLRAPAKDPPIDCFYVYPTVSRDRGLNSDLVMDEENDAAAAQFARFASVCRPFAPKYRQMTVGAIVAFSAGQDITRRGGPILWRCRRRVPQLSSPLATRAARSS